METKKSKLPARVRRQESLFPLKSPPEGLFVSMSSRVTYKNRASRIIGEEAPAGKRKCDPPNRILTYIMIFTLRQFQRKGVLLLLGRPWRDSGLQFRLWGSLFLASATWAFVSAAMTCFLACPYGLISECKHICPHRYLQGAGNPKHRGFSTCSKSVTSLLLVCLIGVLLFICPFFWRVVCAEVIVRDKSLVLSTGGHNNSHLAIFAWLLGRFLRPCAIAVVVCAAVAQKHSHIGARLCFFCPNLS